MYMVYQIEKYFHISTIKQNSIHSYYVKENDQLQKHRSMFKSISQKLANKDYHINFHQGTEPGALEG